MIGSLHLKNFKTFLKLDMNFSKLNVLTGKNSSGKSSVIQAIRILKEYGYRGDGYFSRQENNARSLKSKLTAENFMELSFLLNEKKISCKVSENSFSFLSEITDVPSLTREDYDSISYISADRYGPRNIFEMNNSVPENVGEKGENVFSFLEANQNAYKIVSEKLRKDKSHETLAENIDDWLEVITPGVKLTYTNYENKYFPKYSGIAPVETGYGLSFSLPVIISLLFFDEGKESVLLLENPEAHLHPAAQTEFGKLIANSASLGKQIILETHSDHIIDGIRIAVKESSLLPNDVKLYYFTKQSFEQETKVEMPEMAEDGSLSYWPDGFFDQSLKDKSVLIRGRAKK